jgi:hypothetical protein
MDEKPILLILPRMQGFFSLVFQALGQAHLCEKRGVVPVVYYNKHCPYWSDAGYNDARNVWEYYFEPLSDCDLEKLFALPTKTLEGLSLSEFTELRSGTPITVTDRYSDVIEYRSPIGICFQRKFVNGLFNKYLKIKPHIYRKLDEFCDAHFSSQPVLGVHYRGVEKTHGKVKDWVIARNAHDLKAFYLDEMKRYSRKYPSRKIFVATDSQEFIEDAKSMFGDAVFFRNAVRLAKTEEEVGLHFSEEAKTNGPILGEDVLLDALILSRTNFLIHGISNVSSAALFFNPRLRHADIEFRHGATGTYIRREIIRLISLVSPRIAARMERLYFSIRS